jgi:hypothetical protein
MAKKTTKLPYPHSNLGKYLYRSKLKNEPKISKEAAKHGKSPPTVKKPSRKRIRKMIAQKEPKQ